MCVLCLALVIFLVCKVFCISVVSDNFWLGIIGTLAFRVIRLEVENEIVIF